MIFLKIRRAKNVLFFSLIPLGACGRRAVSPGPLAGTERATSADQTLGTFTMDAYSGTQRQWSLRASHGEIFDRDHRVELKEPRVRFFQGGRSGSTVQAARGRLDTVEKNLWAGGGVVMVSTDGVRLQTDWVRYEKATDRFVSTSPVTLTRGGSRIEGVGWEARADLSEMTVFNQRGEIASEDHRLFRP